MALLVIAMSVGFAQAKRTKHLHKRHATRTEHAQKNAIPLENAIPLCAEASGQLRRVLAVRTLVGVHLCAR